jgi:hypothetical protein
MEYGKYELPEIFDSAGIVMRRDLVIKDVMLFHELLRHLEFA